MGFYTSISDKLNFPAPRNRGGYNAQQLALQKQIQLDASSFNKKVDSMKTYANAPQFSDHVKDFWGIKINEYSDAQNRWVNGDMDSTESNKIQDNINNLWDTWKKAAPYIAALGATVEKYGGAGELDKLNDPNFETLLSHMQKNNGSVTMKNDGSTLYLSGQGEIEERDGNGDPTGNMLPWNYDLDLNTFLETIGVGTFEQGDDETIFTNLNKIIRRKSTYNSIDLEGTLDAAAANSSRTFPVPVIGYDKKPTGKNKDETFVIKELLKQNLNHGGLSQVGFGNVHKGTTMWSGTEAQPSIMNSSNFDSYYANVIYQDYQPHYDENGEIDWLIDYDDEGNEVNRVKPWNTADSSLWNTTRDKLTEDALATTRLESMQLMVELKDGKPYLSNGVQVDGGINYKEIFENKYNGDWRSFTAEGAEGYEISVNPWEFLKGTTANAEGEWQKAYEVVNPDTSITPPPPIEEDVPLPITGAQKIAVGFGGEVNKVDPLGVLSVNKTITALNDLTSEVEGLSAPLSVSQWLANSKIGDELVDIKLSPKANKSSHSFDMYVYPHKEGGTLSKAVSQKLADAGWYINGNDLSGGIELKYEGTLGSRYKPNEIWNVILKELKKIGVNVEPRR